MTKVHVKNLVIEMRKAGYSYSHIAQQMKVSKSTVGIWVANIPYTPNRETIERIGKARAASAAAKNLLKRNSFQSAWREAQDEMGTISNRDLFMLGLGLYIGEGVKSDQSVRFVNANPATMQLIVRWLTESIGLSKNNMRVRLHLYPDTDIDACVSYWSSLLQIPKEQFYQSVIDTRQNKKAIKFGKLPYGTAHLSINSLGEKRFGVFLARKIMAWSSIALQTEQLRD